MPTVTIPREVTSDEITRALTERLGPHYQVQPGKQAHWGFGLAEDADTDSIVVSAGSGRFVRTQVSIQRDGDRSTIRIETPGPLQLRLLNAMGITKKVHQALIDTPQLGAR